MVQARLPISDEITVDPWVQFDDGQLASAVARLLGHSDRFWQAVTASIGGGDAEGEAAKLLPLEGKGRKLVAGHIEFAAQCLLYREAHNQPVERAPVELNDPEVRALVCQDLMNRRPVVSPTGSKRRRHMRMLDYAETLELLERVLSGLCLCLGCDEPAGDRFGEPEYRSDRRKRSAGRYWCCGSHAEWEVAAGKGTAATKRVRDLMRIAADVPHESFEEWVERKEIMRRPSPPSNEDYYRRRRSKTRGSPSPARSDR